MTQRNIRERQVRSQVNGLLALGAVAGLLGAVHPAVAAPVTATWSSASSTDFNNPTNYGGTTPASNDVVFPNNNALVHNPALSSIIAVNSVTIDNSGNAYTIGGTNLSITPTVPTTGLTVTGGGSMTLTAPIVLGTTGNTTAFGQTWNTGSTNFSLGTFYTRYADITNNQALFLTNSTPVSVTSLVKSSLTSAFVVVAGSGSMNISGTITDNGSFITGVSTGNIATATDGTFSGTLTLSNAANSFTGAVNWRTGTLVVGANAPSGSNGALGNSTNAMILGTSQPSQGGSARLLTNGAYTVGRDINIVGAGAGATQTVSLGGSQTAGTSTYSGAISLGRDVSLTAASGGQVDFTNALTGASNRNLTITGGGAVRLAGANTFGGAGTALTVTGGTTLLANSDSALGQGDVVISSGTLTASGGATNNYIDDARTLNIATGSLANLNFIGTDSVAGLILAGLSKSAGVYGAIGNPGVPAGNQSSLFGTYGGAGIDSGTVTVVPEPAALSLLSLAGFGLLARRRRAR